MLSIRPAVLLIFAGCAVVEDDGGGGRERGRPSGTRYTRPAAYDAAQDAQFSPGGTGVYSLQALLDFDTLDGVAVQDGKIALYGHRARPNRLVPIPYLDHLAAALESSDPTFTLTYTPESRREIDRAMQIGNDVIEDKLTNLFDRDDRLTEIGAWWMQKGGVRVKAGTPHLHVLIAQFRATGREKAARVTEVVERYGKVMAAKRPEQEQIDAFADVLRALGIFEQVSGWSREYQAGRLSQTKLYDWSYTLILDTVAKTFERAPDPYLRQYHRLRDQGVDSERAYSSVMTDFNEKSHMKPQMKRMMDEMYKNITEVHVPPEIVAQILGCVPQVVPVWIGMPERSLLARVFFEADVFCKSIMDLPELKKTVPRYRTYFEWRRTVPAAADTEGSGHLWLSPEDFRIAESPDGTAMRFLQAPVRIRLARYVGADERSMDNPILSRYADELTGLYDDIAAAHPVLHEVREGMKLLAVATWLKRQGIRISLPRAGRGTWLPPRIQPGSVHMTIGDEKGPIGMILSAEGGVDGREKWWKFQKSPDAVVLSRDDAVVPSLKGPDAQLRKYTKITEPPPPEIPGSVRRATFGRDAKTRLLVIDTQALENYRDAAQAALHRDRMLQIAKWIEYYDNLINARTRDRVEAMKELEGLKTKAEEWRDDALDALGQQMISNGLAAGDMALVVRSYRGGANEALAIRDLTNAIDNYRGRIQAVSDAMEMVKAGTMDEAKLQSVVGQLTAEGIQWDQTLRTIEGQAPKLARYIAARGALRANLAFGVLDATNRLHDILDLHRMTSDVNDALGTQSKELGQVQKRQKDLIDEYVLEDRKLKALKK